MIVTIVVITMILIFDLAILITIMLAVIRRVIAMIMIVKTQTLNPKAQ